jgi:hypothetical protein
MFDKIIKLISFCFDSIKEGNQYRLEKYGKPLSIIEDMKKCQQQQKDYYKNQVPHSRPFFEKNCESKKIEQYKAKFDYWDEWTGSRYERRDNPYKKMTKSELEKLEIYHIKEIKPYSVCRSNPVTGNWEEI